MPDPVETDTPARALWRVGTRLLARELRSRADSEAVQRAMLSEIPLHLIVEELKRRGDYTLMYDAARQRWLVCVVEDAG